MALFGRSKQFRQSLINNWDRLYRVAYSWTHDAFLAHDLVQETITRALQNKHKITDNTALDIWLFKVMGNYWRDVIRRRKDLTDIYDTELVDSDSPEANVERDRLVKQVRHAVAQLNLDQRQIITLISIQGYSYEQVAEILDIPVGTVMSRICRARQQLKKSLESTLDTTRNSERVWRLK